jgi:hypothetical protein
MKKIFFSILFSCLSFPLFTQQIELQLSSFYYFLPSQSQYYSNPIEHTIINQRLDYKENPGIALNAFYNLTLLNKNDFSVGLGLNWHSYNLKYFERNLTQGDMNMLITPNTFVKETGAINPVCKTSLMWLDLPAVYHYELIDNLTIDGGIEVSALLYNIQTYTYYTLENNSLSTNNKDYKKGISKFLFSLQLGGEYRILKEFSVLLQYHFSLTPLYEKEFRYIDNTRMQGISLGVKYFLSL